MYTAAGCDVRVLMMIIIIIDRFYGNFRIDPREYNYNGICVPVRVILIM